MTLTKYGHSCVMLEDGDYRLLFDPGTFVFADGVLQPSDIAKPDVILITHEHPDHYAPDALREIIGDAGTEIVTNMTLAEKMGGEGFNAMGVDPGEQLVRGPFTIDAIEAAHGQVPAGAPSNVGFFVNDRVLNAGDSIQPTVQRAEILCAPAAAPWATIMELLEYAERLQPRLAVPIHDGYIKDLFLTRLHDYMLRPRLEVAGIEFRPLKPGESVELD